MMQIYRNNKIININRNIHKLLTILIAMVIIDNVYTLSNEQLQAVENRISKQINNDINKQKQGDVNKQKKIINKTQQINIFKINSQSWHKMPVDISYTFAQHSDMTVVITSCNRHNFLQITLNSFFHYNTYILKQLIIIQDCIVSNTNTKQVQQTLWKLLPNGAKHYKNIYFRIIVNDVRLGQIGSIDKAYSFVTTKYVYHLQDDWMQMGSYGFLQKLKDVLQYSTSISQPISQIVQTFPNWQWNHQLSIQYRTKHSTKYHTITAYGKQYLYSFSFNPHLIDYQKIYKSVINGSYMENIAKRFHCTNKIQGKQLYEMMKNGGCVQHETGKYLNKLGYKQAYVAISNKPMYMHLGNKTQSYSFNVINFEIQSSQIQAKAQDRERQGESIEDIQQKQQQTKAVNQQSQTQKQPYAQKQDSQLKKFMTQIVIIIAISIFFMIWLKLYTTLYNKRQQSTSLNSAKQTKPKKQPKSYNPSTNQDLIQQVGVLQLQKDNQDSQDSQDSDN